MARPPEPAFRGVRLDGVTRPQLDRLERVDQPFYVLDAQPVDGGVACRVSGSTGAPYRVALADGRFKCSCPDHALGARKHGVVCKHVCFLVWTVGGARGPECAEFFRTRRLGPAAAAALAQRLLVASAPPPQPRDPDADCPVCFMPLPDGPVRTCRTCCNGVHVECFRRWQAHGGTRAGCVFCRAL